MIDEPSRDFHSYVQNLHQVALQEVQSTRDRLEEKLYNERVARKRMTFIVICLGVVVTLAVTFLFAFGGVGTSEVKAVQHSLSTAVSSLRERVGADIDRVSQDLANQEAKIQTSLLPLAKLDDELKRVERVRSQLLDETAALTKRMDTLSSSVSELRNRLDGLNAEQLAAKLTLLERQTAELSGYVKGIKEMLSPETVTMLSNVERMKAEIDARKDFEGRLSKAVDEYGKISKDRLDKIEGDQKSLSSWIIGLLVTIAGSLVTLLIGLGIFVYKRIFKR